VNVDTTTVLQWRKSPTSGAGGECVEVARAGDMVLLRESDEPDTVIVMTTPAKFARFIEGVKLGAFDDLAS
jgi:hypothetical protein